ncbi:hypothetical protein PYW08_008848 [Mythimna loreyi]|uniref:Uncharacterized protein n=1 Tax=Mythimna loreyi TaxID=667449 RepID=A0ACC2QBL1_9NEOP|nr:hypothetical protein PYW08_008848 [Mythimna loreyi]
MKLILLVLASFSCGNINARLIEKITDRALTTETKTTGSSPPVRLTRDAFDEDSGTGSFKEDGSDEQVPYNKKTRNYSRSKPKKVESPSPVRVTRESQEKIDKPKIKNTTVSQHAPPKQKTLVKKPIPKYNNEMDYDEDFQMKMNRSPVRVIDSGEHEDEDFNVDDYDFDVNHDEFIGRGKPLEPRLKNKGNQDNSNPPPVKKEAKVGHHPVVKTQSKEQLSPASHRPISNKRSAPYIPKKAGEKEDYYDDTTTTPAPPEKEKVTRDSDDEFGDDNEESKEFEGKPTHPSVRTIRSPWKLSAFMDKYGAAGNAVMSKVLTILPMFPAVPKTHDDLHLIAPTNDPWRSQRF